MAALCALALPWTWTLRSAESGDRRTP
jgi:hypothetical protein